MTRRKQPKPARLHRTSDDAVYFPQMSQTFRSICETFGVEPTHRQYKKFVRGEGRAYRLHQHFGPIHETRTAENGLITRENEIRQGVNKRRQAANEARIERNALRMEAAKEAGENLEEVEQEKVFDLLPILALHPVPATEEEIKVFLDTTSR